MTDTTIRYFDGTEAKAMLLKRVRVKNARSIHHCDYDGPTAYSNTKGTVIGMVETDGSTAAPSLKLVVQWEDHPVWSGREWHPPRSALSKTAFEYHLEVLPPLYGVDTPALIAALRERAGADANLEVTDYPACGWFHECLTRTPVVEIDYYPKGKNVVQKP